jgi:hypothetical protein
MGQTNLIKLLLNQDDSRGDKATLNPVVSSPAFSLTNVLHWC